MKVIIMLIMSLMLVAQVQAQNPLLGIDLDIEEGGNVNPYISVGLKSQKWRNTISVSPFGVKAEVAVPISSYLSLGVFSRSKYKQFTSNLEVGAAAYATLPYFKKIKPLVGLCLSTSQGITASIQIRYKFYER